MHHYEATGRRTCIIGGIISLFNKFSTGIEHSLLKTSRRSAVRGISETRP